MDNKEFEAIKSLSFRTSISPNRMNMSSEEFKQMIIKMGKENLLTYELIEKHPVFEGDFGRITITSKGEQVYEMEQKRRNKLNE